MTSKINLWEKALNADIDKETTDPIVPFFRTQAEQLRSASNGKIGAVFEKTTVIDKEISHTLDYSAALEAALTMPTNLLQGKTTPKVDLKNANSLYENTAYSFEIRNNTYRFRMFELTIGPLFPVKMLVDEGIYEDTQTQLANYSQPTDTNSCNVLIFDYESIEKTFEELLTSKKVKYILHKLNNE